ncbi:MAG: ABC transporter permease [Spirochaetaceae bacterium]|jgi:osmoprotectant transport system permease protein|nr:ABC transporter permease [Spirochaetaceae bacterium]
MIAYLVRYHTRLLEVFAEHILLLGITLVISIFTAAVLAAAVSLNRRVENSVLRILGAVYAVPSLALFSILIPFLGIGLKTAVFVLVLYNQFLLLRNFCAGLRSVDNILIEAAQAMGMTSFQMLVKIKVPLALPVIMAGIRLAALSTTGTGTIAAVINAGGIGTLLFDGLRTMNSVKILWGTFLAAGLALAVNALLSLLETHLQKKLNPHISQGEIP